MTRMSTIHSRLSYGTGTTLTGRGISTKTYTGTVKTAKEVSRMLVDRTVGLGLSDWVIIVGITCTVITCAVNWYYRKKEREGRLNGNATKVEE